MATQAAFNFKAGKMSYRPLTKYFELYQERYQNTQKYQLNTEKKKLKMFPQKVISLNKFMVISKNGNCKFPSFIYTLFQFFKNCFEISVNSAFLRRNCNVSLITFSNFQANRVQRRWSWTGDFKCREVKTGFYRKKWGQTGSSGTLIGWKSGQTTFVPLWDRMEGAWLWTQRREGVAAYLWSDFSSPLFYPSLLV